MSAAEETPTVRIPAATVRRGDHLVFPTVSGTAVQKLVVGTSLAMPQKAGRVALLGARHGGKTPAYYYDLDELVDVVPGWVGVRADGDVVAYVSRAAAMAALGRGTVVKVRPGHVGGRA